MEAPVVSQVRALQYQPPPAAYAGAAGRRTADAPDVPPLAAPEGAEAAELRLTERGARHRRDPGGRRRQAGGGEPAEAGVPEDGERRRGLIIDLRA